MDYIISELKRAITGFEERKEKEPNIETQDVIYMLDRLYQLLSEELKRQP